MPRWKALLLFISICLIRNRKFTIKVRVTNSHDPKKPPASPVYPPNLRQVNSVLLKKPCVFLQTHSTPNFSHPAHSLNCPSYSPRLSSRVMLTSFLKLCVRDQLRLIGVPNFARYQSHITHMLLVSIRCLISAWHLGYK